MTTTPILFSTAMVQAILKGQKTQTRRLQGLEKFNEHPEWFRYDGTASYPDQPQYYIHYFESLDVNGLPTEKYTKVKAKVKPGDVLWVRETFYKDNNEAEFITKPSTHDTYSYKADDFHKDVKRPGVNYDHVDLCTEGWHDPDYPENPKWKPSIFMPKEACRLFLEVTDVRAERLQEISAKDAIDEGIKHVIDKVTGFCGWNYKSGGYNLMTSAQGSFKTLWEYINGEASWNKNPWVWVYTFKRTEQPANFISY